MSAIQDLLQTMARLRGEGGCPWDREQTHASLAETLVEETSELLEALDTGDMPLMREELGDVLLQVVFHAQMAQERGDFSFEDVAREINDKLVRRHPHVFGSASADTSAQVLTQWDQIKAAEKQAAGKAAEGPFKPLPPRLPALLFARDVFKQIQKKELPVGQAVDLEGIQLLSEDLDEAEAGRLFFELAAACRLAGIDPESALRRYTQEVITQVSAEVAARS